MLRPAALRLFAFLCLAPSVALFAIPPGIENRTSKIENLLRSPRPLVIGHRGYAAAAPENTLASFRLATLAGADLVELDYHHTADGALLVIHDATLDRTTDAPTRWGARGLRVADKTLAELQTLDVGSGQRLPLLLDAITQITADGSVTLIERKVGDAATLARFLREHDLINRVVIQAFDWQFLAELHALLPEQILGALGPPHVRAPGVPARPLAQPDDAAFTELAAAGVSLLVWNGDLSPASTAATHAHGLRVWCYTIDDPARARALLAQGVDGLITNNPALIWKTLAVEKIKPTQP